MSALVAKELQEQNRILEEILTRAYLDRVYPVGSVYINVNNTNPSNFIGGTWERLKDRFLLGAGDAYAAGATGGSADAVVVEHYHEVPTRGGVGVGGAITEIKAGYHTILETGVEGTNDSKKTTNAGESGLGKNMPPYIAVYMWKRIA